MSDMIVPNELRDAINAKLDAALAEFPEAAVERDNLYAQLLAHFDEHGVVPDFSIVKRVEAMLTVTGHERAAPPAPGR